MPDRLAGIQVLLAHPGGPFWSRRDHGWWSVPKGEIGPGEEPLDAAEREFSEELGVPPPAGVRSFLGEVVQAGGKHVLAYAVEGDLDPAAVVPGTVDIEWPPRSGRTLSIPEVDRVEWFSLVEARDRLLGGQLPFLDRLEQLLGMAAGGAAGRPPAR